MTVSLLLQKFLNLRTEMIFNKELSWRKTWEMGKSLMDPTEWASHYVNACLTLCWLHRSFIFSSPASHHEHLVRDFSCETIKKHLFVSVVRGGTNYKLLLTGVWVTQRQVKQQEILQANHRQHHQKHTPGPKESQKAVSLESQPGWYICSYTIRDPIKD